MKLLLSAVMMMTMMAAHATTNPAAKTSDEPRAGTDVVLPSEKTDRTVNDAQIAAIVKTANDGEIDAGKYAKAHAKNKQVREFASEMVMHHQRSNQDASKLLSKINVKPEANQTSKDLKQSVKSDMTAMKSLKGDEYDQAYMRSQVATHEKVLNTLDTSLIPSAKNAQLKAMLEETRDVVAKHLDEAKTIQAAL